MQMLVSLTETSKSSKMVHAALLLLMLEAVFTDLVSTISLNRSTQNLQLSTSCRPITPSYGGSAPRPVAPPSPQLELPPFNRTQGYCD